MKRWLLITAFVAALAGLPGCLTLRDQSESAREQEARLALQEDLDRVKGKLEALEMEYQRLLREQDALKSQASGSKDEAGTAQQRLNELERRLSMLEDARVKDRQAIVEQLSGKLAEIMSGGPPARKSIVTLAPLGANAEGKSGYEHIVQDGETLSTIAAAYKVKLSAIIEANQLQNPDALLPGQKLFIPQP